MQMYLFRDSGSRTALDYRNINGGDDSGIVWHEYTHGLSGRLVTNADGSHALSTPHAGAMGEGWSDWFASDFQVRDGIKADDLGTPGEIDIGAYTDLDPHKLRSQAADCPVGAVDARCPGGDQTSIGGYTLGDFGKIAGAPEVHADGEIWFETLWDLRQALQVKTGARRGVRRRRVAHRPTACGSRRPSRRCSTCATRSWPRTRPPPPAARSTTSCGTCSASAEWATSPP